MQSSGQNQECFLAFLKDQDVTNLVFWHVPRYVILPYSAMTVKVMARGGVFSG